MPRIARLFAIFVSLATPVFAETPSFRWTKDTQVCVMPTRLAANGLSAEMVAFLSGSSLALGSRLMSYTPYAPPADWNFVKVHLEDAPGSPTGLFHVGPKTPNCRASDLTVTPSFRVDGEAYTLTARVSQSGHSRPFARTIGVKPEEIPTAKTSKEAKQAFAYRLMALMQGVGCDIGRSIGNPELGDRCD